MKIITLEKLHSLLNEAYAVEVNAILYFVGEDDDGLFIADNDGQDRVNLSEVDGDIEVTGNGYFFYVAEDPILLKILHIALPEN